MDENNMNENNMNQQMDDTTENSQPQYNYQPNDNLEPVISVGQWVIISLVMSIPCVNIIMLFVWGFGDGNRNRANYCKAALILWIIGMLLSALVVGVMGTTATMFNTGAVSGILL